MKEPVDHILRPRLPWRDPRGSAVTECGYDASKVACLTRADFFKRVKDLGQQRAAMITCMTCSQTAARYPTWEEDPRRALEREIVWECGGWRGEKRGHRLRDELTAIAALIDAHPAEFAAVKAEIEQRRAWNERKAGRDKKPDRPPDPPTTTWRPI